MVPRQRWVCWDIVVSTTRNVLLLMALLIIVKERFHWFQLNRFRVGPQVGVFRAAHNTRKQHKRLGCGLYPRGSSVNETSANIVGVLRMI